MHMRDLLGPQFPLLGSQVLSLSGVLNSALFLVEVKRFLVGDAVGKSARLPFSQYQKRTWEGGFLFPISLPFTTKYLQPGGQGRPFRESSKCK